jgi:serine kinase of HPr protein (carbohydrate metabolism regulator)
VTQSSPTIHATALLFGDCGILIRGPSGSGKSALALALLDSAGERFARLVGDDRIHLEAAHGRLLMRPATALQGLIEIRGLGIVRVPFEPVAVVHLVVDLDTVDLARLPDPADLATSIEGVRLARLPVAPGADARARLLGFLRHHATLRRLPQA